MRIRTIKPEWLEDEGIALASMAARVVSIGLILSADDEGRLRCNSAVLGARIFPGMPDAVSVFESAMAELEAIGFVVRYEDEGKKYAAIPGFARHQKVNRPNASRLPPPPQSVSTHGGLTEDSLNPHGALTEQYPPEGKGRERNGMEGNGVDAREDAPPNDDEHQTLCPADFASKLPSTVVPELAKAHKVPEDAIRRALDEFVAYWTVGGGTGTRRKSWPRTFRQRVHELAKRGDLGAQARASPSGPRQRAVDPEYMARC